MPMRPTATLLVLLFVIAAIASPQSVSEQDGRIFFTDPNGVRKPITNGTLDAQPHLSLDKRQIVFVRKTPGQTAETGSGDVDKTELWIAPIDGGKEPKRVLTGGGLIEGPNLNIVIGGFSNPQFSPDATRIYFEASAWTTAGAMMMLDVATGHMKLLFPGLGVDVIRTGTYRGFLIGIKDPITQDRGRIMVYWLLNPDGKEIIRIGESDSDLDSFKRKYDIH
jgi:hypothetical protein